MNGAMLPSWRTRRGVARAAGLDDGVALPVRRGLAGSGLRERAADLDGEARQAMMGVAAIGPAHRGLELHPEILERCGFDVARRGNEGCFVAMRWRGELEEDVGEHLVVGGLGALAARWLLASSDTPTAELQPRFGASVQSCLSSSGRGSARKIAPLAQRSGQGLLGAYSFATSVLSWRTTDRSRKVSKLVLRGQGPRSQDHTWYLRWHG